MLISAAQKKNLYFEQKKKSLFHPYGALQGWQRGSRTFSNSRSGDSVVTAFGTGYIPVKFLQEAGIRGGERLRRPGSGDKQCAWSAEQAVELERPGLLLPQLVNIN